jgi:hypothetical protein
VSCFSPHGAVDVAESDTSAAAFSDDVFFFDDCELPDENHLLLDGGDEFTFNASFGAVEVGHPKNLALDSNENLKAKLKDSSQTIVKLWKFYADHEGFELESRTWRGVTNPEYAAFNKMYLRLRKVWWYCNYIGGCLRLKYHTWASWCTDSKVAGLCELVRVSLSMSMAQVLDFLVLHYGTGKLSTTLFEEEVVSKFGYVDTSGGRFRMSEQLASEFISSILFRNRM